MTTKPIASAGATQQQKLVGLYIKPLHSCADEIHSLRASGKSAFGKEDVVVKRLLNQLERIFVADTRQDPGAFFDFLLCSVAFIAENDTDSGSVARLKGRFTTSATEQLFQIKNKMSSAADMLRSKLNTDDAGATRDRSASTIIASNSGSSELDLLLRPIEAVQTHEISNRLDSLHYWIIRCLRLPGAFQATMKRCVIGMPDILVGFVGTKSPFFLTDEESSASPSKTTTTSSPRINDNFIDEFIAAIARLESHPTMGPITYDININTMDLFQTATSHNDDYRGGGVVDMYNKGKKNDHAVRFKIGIKTKPAAKNWRKPRKFHGVDASGALQMLDQKLQTDDAITGYRDHPHLHHVVNSPSPLASSPQLWTPSNWSPGDPLTSAAAAQNIMNMSNRASPAGVSNSANKSSYTDNAKEEIFDRQLQKRGGGGKQQSGGGGKGGTTTTGSGDMCRNQGVQPDNMFKVLSFPELCGMYRAVEEDQAKVRAEWKELLMREEAFREKEKKYEANMQSVAKLVINLDDLYSKHANKIREKQLLGQRVLIRDFDKKVEEVLNVFDVGDFDLVEDEDELNAAGVASSRNFLFSGKSPTSHGEGQTFGGRGSGWEGVSVVGAGSQIRPLVVVDEDETKAPHTQVGTLELKLREPQEVERSVQIKKQNSRCPDCGVFFGEDSENRLVDVVKKASQRIMHQKPRRCHYCTQHLCHTCHVNDTSILPFRALLKWDFTYEHVCKKCHRFLEANFDRALFDIRRIAPEIRQRKLVVTCMDIRKHLIRAAFVIRECTHRTSAALAEELNTHYFMREFFFSLKDLYKLAKEESKGTTPIAYVPGATNVIDMVTSVAGVDNQSLNSFLATKLLKCREHIAATCPSCRMKASMPCGICRRAEPVFVYDQEADQCHECRTIFHDACMAKEPCPVCADNASGVAVGISVSSAPGARKRVT